MCVGTAADMGVNRSVLRCHLVCVGTAADMGMNRSVLRCHLVCVGTAADTGGGGGGGQIGTKVSSGVCGHCC